MFLKIVGELRPEHLDTIRYKSEQIMLAPKTPLTLTLSKTNGGNVCIAYNIMCILAKLINSGINVITIADSYVCSSSIWIFLMGKERIIMDGCIMIAHELLCSVRKASTKDLVKIIAQMEEYKNAILSIMKQRFNFDFINNWLEKPIYVLTQKEKKMLQTIRC